MNDKVREQLRNIIKSYGPSVCEDPRRCEGLLRDLGGEHRSEIFVLISALKERVAADLLVSSDGMPIDMLLARLRKRMQDNLAFSADSAQWAVESWALALGKLSPQKGKASPQSHPLEVAGPAASSLTPEPATPRLAFTPSTKTSYKRLTARRPWMIAGLSLALIIVGATIFLFLNKRNSYDSGSVLEANTRNVDDKSVGQVNQKKLPAKGTSPTPRALPVGSVVSPNGSMAVFPNESNSLVRENSSFLVDLTTGKQEAIPLRVFPETIRAKMKSMVDGKWHLFRDDAFQWSDDGKRVAFRRCSGDEDKPVCLLFLYTPANPGSLVLMGEQLHTDNLIPNFYPIKFVNQKLIFSLQPLIFSADLQNGKVSLLANDGWSPEISPDQQSIAYLTSFRTGGGNLWLMNINGGSKRQLTKFSKMVPVRVAWSTDANRIFFDLQSEETHDTHTWVIDKVGSNLRKVSNRQANYLHLDAVCAKTYTC